MFDRVFDLFVVEFESLDETFDELVNKLEGIEEEQGGSVHDDDRARRVTYSRDGVSFTFEQLGNSHEQPARIAERSLTTARTGLASLAGEAWGWTACYYRHLPNTSEVQNV